MGATPNLTNTSYQMNTDNESLVWKVNTMDITGGRSLDVTGFTPEVIAAGHVIIHETASGTFPSGTFKPMPVNGGATAYAALPAGHTYAGIVKANALTSKPFVGIGTGGQVNPDVCPYDLDTILAAVKTALPHIQFMAD